MPSRFAAKLCVLSLPLILQFLPHARAENLAPDFSKTRTFIQEALDAKRAPSVSVAVINKDGEIWAEAFGFANVETKVKATPDTIYRLASVSKPITATGLMVAKDRGLIELDAPANRYLPGAKLRAHVGSPDEMTIRRIANHTSGLPVYYNFYYDSIPPATMDETIRRYGAAVTEPGKTWTYSNLGFGILGYLTEVAAETPWREFMEKSVYDPLGMTRTSDRIRPGHEADAAIQYTKDAFGKFLPVGAYDFDHPGASVVRSSANDLGRFARMHLNMGILDGVRVLSEESARTMQELTGKRGEGQGNGVGWAIETYKKRHCVSHSGGMPGVSTMLRLFPEEGIATIVLVNGEANTLVADVTGRLVDAVFRDMPKKGTDDVAKKDDSAQKKAEEKDAPKPSADETKAKSEEERKAWTGTWRGTLFHFDGDIPVRLVVKDGSDVRLQLGDAQSRSLEGVGWDGPRLTGSINGKLKTNPSFHGVPFFVFSLERTNDRVTGLAVVEGAEYFHLPHWVELKREPAPPETKVANRTTEPPFDLLIKNGRTVDGCGTPWQPGDVAIRAGRIVAMGRLGAREAARTVDAAGLIVAPGFIDMMGQTASPFLTDPRAGDNLLAQGITTINAGEGDSAAPLGDDEGKRTGWRTMAEYFDKLDRVGMPINVVQTVGHTQVRRIVIGEVDRRATPAELERMEGLVREGMEAGAVGVSTALIYPPAVYAPTEEIVALAKVAGAYGGRYYTHMRNEGDRLLEAIDEALAIGAAAKTPVHIFHLKAAGQANWPKMEQAIARIKSARAAGQPVAADIYPYINNGLDLVSFIHPRHAAQGTDALRKKLGDPAVRAEIRREMETERSWENWYRHIGSDWNNVVLGGMEKMPYVSHGGESLAAIAKALNKDPWDVFFEISQQGAFALPQSMSEANVIKAMRQEFVSFDTDVGPAGGSHIATHPRGFGAFPRVLARYVRELGILPLETAVSRMTAVAANELMLADRGRLAPGLAADIVIFDEDQIRDQATLARPAEPSQGVRHVIVNGQLVLTDGKPVAAKPGRVLRGPGYRGTPSEK